MSAVEDTDQRHEYWMQQALELAQQAAQQGEVPVGAVLVHEQRIIGAGFNQPINRHDPTAHAEICAIRDACQRLQNYRLPPNTTLYVTLEPCTQCVGALIHARVQHVVFAAAEPRAGSLVSARQLMQSGFYNHFFSVEGGVLAEQSQQLLKQFFAARRQKKQNFL
ncbi:tRNA adenosine(34) deaminase TadA [Alkanindiges sp. WGS2144]|uniref:tRNA adenosine(34) deaminase TadA n=1 Tax=Alkanindiges sp. WGS2144 TaxID=3366808 RepID=UPI0037527F53